MTWEIIKTDKPTEEEIVQKIAETLLNKGNSW